MIHLDDEESISRSKSIQMNALRSGEKGKLPSFYRIAFWILLKKRSSDVWFKNKCAFDISQFARDRKLFLSHDKAYGFHMLSLEILYWADGVFAELTSICWCVRALDVVYTGNAYNTSDTFRGRSIIETVNWLG